MTFLQDRSVSRVLDLLKIYLVQTVFDLFLTCLKLFVWIILLGPFYQGFVVVYDFFFFFF
jgi:hypothetical protein